MQWTLTGLLLVTLSAPVLPPAETVEEEPEIAGQKLSVWTAQLRDEDPVVRRLTIQRLGKLGPKARVVAPALIAALQDPVPQVRKEAITALGAIGKDAVGPLAAALKDKDVGTRQWAASLLEDLGPDAVDALPALIAALNDEDPRVAYWVCKSLGYIGKPAVPALIAALQDKDRIVRCGAIKALSLIQPVPKGVFSCATFLLVDKEAKVRARAADVLPEMAADGHVAVGPLLSALHDPEAEVRAAAALALGRLRIEVGAVRPPLTAALHDPASIVRAAAADSLAEVGIEATDVETVNSLIVAIATDHDAAVRLGAVRVLARTDLSDGRLAQGLVNALRDPDYRIRKEALLRLSRFDRKAEPGLALLLAALHDESDYVREAAITELIGKGKNAVPPMCFALNDSEAKVRQSAVIVLGYLGAFDAPGPATGPLAAALTDPDEEVRRAAATALSGFGPDAVAAIPALKAAMKDKDPAVREAAEAALEHIDAAPDKAGGKP